VAPEVGYEVDGIPLDFAWPDRRVAVAVELAEEDRAEVEAQGWTFLPADAEQITAALAAREAGVA